MNKYYNVELFLKLFSISGELLFGIFHFCLKTNYADFSFLETMQSNGLSVFVYAVDLSKTLVKICVLN